MKVVPSASDQFEISVLKEFSFLERDYGFSKSIIRPNAHSTIINYKNYDVFVNLVFGPPAYEPEMSFGRLGVDDRQGGFNFEAGDLIQLGSCRGWAKKGENLPPLEGQVAWLAALLGECGRPCLLGDSVVYAEMKSRRETLVMEWQRDERAKAQAGEIDTAWKAKDYQTVIRLCSAYDGVLSDINRKRLEVARGKV
ncbi:MAG: hypothetical protein AB7G24_02300 [Novosphingobium sp.]